MGVWWEDIVKEVKKQLWLAGPMISVTLSLFGLQVIAVMFVGHLGELALSGASMATSFAGVTGFTIMLGMASALDTFCGQSYGAEHYHMLGIHTQRAMFVLLLVCIPLALTWMNTKSILIALHQDHSIAEEAGIYARCMIPGLFGYALIQCYVKFLQNQSIVFPMVLSTAITFALHILLCWTLVFKSGLGSKGAAVASSISYWINVLFLALYVKLSPSCKQTWTGFSKQAFHDIPRYLFLAVPSTLMVCLEACTFELMVILAGLLPNPKLETSILSICVNTSGMLWSVPFGLGAAASTRVANELGAGHPKVARLAMRVITCMGIILGILMFTFLMSIRNIWGHAFSNSEEVIRKLASMMPLLASTALLDAIQTVLSGVCRGCGWQKIGAIVNLGSYYFVGVPLAIVLAFVYHVKYKGLWLGILSALAVQVVLLMVFTLLTNWEKEAKKAAKKVQETAVPMTTLLALGSQNAAV